MQVPIEITFRNMDRSPALAADIQEKVKKLEDMFDRIVRCRVVVEAPHRRHQQGNLYQIRIHLSVPRRELMAGHLAHDEHQHEDPFVAVSDAFDALRRQLTAYVEELHGRTKSHAESRQGEA